MPTNYPNGIDDFTNPGPNDSMEEVSHSSQHTNANDAIEAIEAELGATPSGPFDSVGDRFEAIEEDIVEITDELGATPSGSFDSVSQRLDSLFAKDGSIVATGSFAMGGNRITGIANGNANTDAVNLGQVLALLDQQSGEWVEGGSSSELDLTVPLLHVDLQQDWYPSIINAQEGKPSQIAIWITNESGSDLEVGWPPEIFWLLGTTAPTLIENNKTYFIILNWFDPVTVYGATWIEGQERHPIKEPGDVSGLVQHFDAHENADSFVLADTAKANLWADFVDLFAGTPIAYRGDLVCQWTAEVGGNAVIDEGFPDAQGGAAIYDHGDGRRGLVFHTQKALNAGAWGAALEFPALGVLANHTIVIVCGPIPADNDIGLPAGYGDNGIALTNDHTATLLGDDYIFGFNFPQHSGSIGARWQENGGSTSNRTISDPRDAPNFADVYATRYDGTDWHFYRHSPYQVLDTYSQENIDLGDNQWAIGSTPSRAIPWNGVIYEIAMYDEAIDEADLKSIMDGLVLKWKIIP